MNKIKTSLALLKLVWVVPCLILFLNSWASADASLPEVIDKTNWKEIEGLDLIPEQLLAWIKKGDAILPVGELSFDVRTFNPVAVEESLTSNVGKFALDKAGNIIEAKTGNIAECFEGLPFPKIDVDDPDAGAKIIYNKFLYTYAVGNTHVRAPVYWVGRQSGVEREMVANFIPHPIVGFPSACKKSNRDLEMARSIIAVTSPFDIKGTNILTWRFLDERPDTTFAYVPAIRRARRMSPANRSDSFVGTDICADDMYGYDGKTSAFEWKLLRKVEQLVPFTGKDPDPVAKTRKGEWETTPQVKKKLFGLDDKESQGAPWFMTNSVFVKRPTYILEAKAKDPYYNYGTQYLWVDAECYQPTYKVIYDRSDKYWKFEWNLLTALESEDGKWQYIILSSVNAVDERRDHACVIPGLGPNHPYTFEEVQNPHNYTLAGFMKFCK